jgi:hypothetical protein
MGIKMSSISRRGAAGHKGVGQLGGVGRAGRAERGGQRGGGGQEQARVTARPKSSTKNDQCCGSPKHRSVSGIDFLS